MIVFHKVRWKNLLGTGNVWNEILIDSYKTTIITGTNGAGKSSFLDALAYGLYGRAFRNINKNQLVNSINNKDMVVEITMSANGHEYLIRRGLKPNIFEIWEDGIQKDQDAAIRDDQTYVERSILKFNFKAFTQIVVVGIASYVPFMKLPAAHRRTVIEEILDLQIFSVMGVLLKKRIQDNKDAIADINSKIALTEQKIELHTQHLESMRESHEAIIQSKQDTIKQNQDHIDKAKVEAEEVQKQINELEATINDSQTVINKQQKLLSYKTQIKSKKQKINSEMLFFEKSDRCPTCTQEIDIDKKIGEVKFRKAKIAEIEQGETKLAEELALIETRLKEIEEVEEKISELSLSFESVKNNIDVKNHYITELTKEIETLETQRQSFTGDASSMLEFQEELLTHHEVKEKLIRDKSIYEFTINLLSDNGIKSRIIKQYIQIINKLVAKYLSQMDFMVQFELDENFNETIKSRYRDEYSYESFSAGEQLRINLALLFTWRAIAKMRNSASTNLLVMDELFDSSLDNTGITDLLKILESLTGDTNTFIISHRTELVDKFEQTIRFEKHKNFCKMIQEEITT